MSETMKNEIMRRFEVLKVFVGIVIPAMVGSLLALMYVGTTESEWDIAFRVCRQISA